jgi:hypothetical protein
VTIVRKSVNNREGLQRTKSAFYNQNRLRLPLPSGRPECGEGSLFAFGSLDARVQSSGKLRPGGYTHE